jgi:hypothetical protein
MHRGAGREPRRLDVEEAGAGRGPRRTRESKLCDVLLAFAVRRRWPSVFSNAVNPGWVATKMGGPGAPDSQDEGRRTQGGSPSATIPKRGVGKYFAQQRPAATIRPPTTRARQDKLLELCQRFSGVALADA